MVLIKWKRTVRAKRKLHWAFFSNFYLIRAGDGDYGVVLGHHSLKTAEI